MGLGKESRRGGLPPSLFPREEAPRVPLSAASTFLLRPTLSRSGLLPMPSALPSCLLPPAGAPTARPLRLLGFLIVHGSLRQVRVSQTPDRESDRSSELGSSQSYRAIDEP